MITINELTLAPQPASSELINISVSDTNGVKKHDKFSWFLHLDWQFTSIEAISDSKKTVSHCTELEIEISADHATATLSNESKTSHKTIFNTYCDKISHQVRVTDL